MKISAVALDRKTVFAVVGAAVLYLGLRVYVNFAATGITDIARWITEAFPQTQSRWGLFWAAWVMLQVPFVATNSFAIGLVLAFVFRKGLWKLGLAVGILSELGWILVWCFYIWGRSGSSLISAVTIL